MSTLRGFFLLCDLLQSWHPYGANFW